MRWSVGAALLAGRRRGLGRNHQANVRNAHYCETSIWELLVKVSGTADINGMVCV